MTPWLRVLLLTRKNQSSNLGIHISSLKNIYNQYGGFPSSGIYGCLHKSTKTDTCIYKVKGLGI